MKHFRLYFSSILLSIFCIQTTAQFNVLQLPYDPDSQEISFEPFSQTRTINGETIVSHQMKNKLRIALFDTHRNCRYVYQPFIDLAKTLNMHVDYYSIGNILDSSPKKFPLELYDGAFFILCSEFLKTLKTSPVSERILELVENYSKLPKKLVGLMLPSMNPCQNNLLSPLAPLFEKTGIMVKADTIALKENPSYKPKICSLFFKTTNQFLNAPIERRSIHYHTTLKLPEPGKTFQCTQTFDSEYTPLAILPIKQNYPDEIKATLPYGIYWFNPARKNHLIISNSSLLSFAGISENFQLYPINISIRTGLQDAFHETLWELSQLLMQKNHEQNGLKIQNILKQKKPSLPHSTKKLQAFVTNQTENSYPKKTAWMEINIFEHEKESTQQNKLINFIIDSRIDSLWLSISPNVYYSPIAKEKDKREKFLKTLSVFTKQLSKKAQQKKVTPPHILIGFEIANNLHSPNLPKKCAYDLYGNRYPDMPQPLDKKFWKNEIIIPLTQFLVDWQNHSISNNIMIEGIVIDFEMYNRKTTGAFLPTMGFEPDSAKQFPIIPSQYTQNPHTISQYLMENQKTKPYFHILEAEAKRLGNELRTFVRNKIPNAIIGCYAPNISTDWFYKGIYKGLSKPENPILLLTFNSEFYAHKDWLTSHRVQAKHASVLMLSKIRSKDDFTWVDYILQRHDGIWFNRFSRMAEPYHKDWSTLEQTSLTMDDRNKFAKYLGTK